MLYKFRYGYTRYKEEVIIKGLNIKNEGLINVFNKLESGQLEF